MSFVVGLDIGTRTVTGAVFSGKPGRFRMVDFFVESIPALDAEQAEQDEDGEIAAPLSAEEIVQQVLARKNLKLADVVTAVDSKDCVVREFPVPFTRDEQIAKTIFFEAESHFPGLDLEDTTLEYLKVGEQEGRSHLVVWALRNEVLERHLQRVKSVGIDPVHVDLDATALFNAFASTPVYSPERTTLLVEMGATSTKILLVEDGKVKKARSLRLETFVPSPDRLIPEPAADGEGPSSPEVSIEVVGEGDGDGAFEDATIEARFREIEDALRRLDPVSGAEPDAADSEPGDDGDDGDDGRSALADAPIAILSDDEYDLVREEPEETAEDAGALPARADGGAEGGSAGETEGRADGPRFPGMGREERTFDYSDYLSRIGQEIQRSLVGSQLSRPIELICLTGGMSGREEARRYFTEEFDVETIHLDFGDSFPSDLPEEQRSAVGRFGAVAVGLGLKGIGQDEVGLDFRKGRFRFEHRFERMRFPAVVAAILIFLNALQLTFFTIQPWKTERQRLANFVAHSADVYEAFFGKKLAEGREALGAAQERARAWKGKGKGVTDRFLEPAEVLQDVSRVLQSAGLGWYKITSMKLEMKLSMSRASRGSQPRLSARGKSQLVIVTDDESPVVKIENAFRGGQSKVFDCQALSSPGRSEAKYKVTLNLTVKASKLRELQ